MPPWLIFRLRRICRALPMQMTSVKRGTRILCLFPRQSAESIAAKIERMREAATGFDNTKSAPSQKASRTKAASFAALSTTMIGLRFSSRSLIRCINESASGSDLSTKTTSNRCLSTRSTASWVSLNVTTVCPRRRAHGSDRFSDSTAHSTTTMIFNGIFLTQRLTSAPELGSVMT